MLAVPEPSIAEHRLADVYDYWNRKRRGRAMPARADIDPVDIPHLLGRLYLVDTAETLGAFRFRLYGSALAQGFGRDRTGSQFHETPEIHGDAAVAGAYWRVYSDGLPDYVRGRPIAPDTTFRMYSRLLLPLSDDGVQVNMILGAIVFFFRADLEAARASESGRPGPSRNG